MFTRPLSTNLLQANGLFAEDAIAASDHLPVFADFEVKNVSSIHETAISNFQLEIAPNPVFEKIAGSFNLEKSVTVELSIFNITGQKIIELLNEKLPEGVHQFNFENTKLPKGLYFLTLKTDNQTAVLKIIKN